MSPRRKWKWPMFEENTGLRLMADKVLEIRTVVFGKLRDMF